MSRRQQILGLIAVAAEAVAATSPCPPRRVGTGATWPCRRADRRSGEPVVAGQRPDRCRTPSPTATYGGHRPAAGTRRRLPDGLRHRLRTASRPRSPCHGARRPRPPRSSWMATPCWTTSRRLPWYASGSDDRGYAGATDASGAVESSSDEVWVDEFVAGPWSRGGGAATGASAGRRLRSNRRVTACGEPMPWSPRRRRWRGRGPRSLGRRDVPRPRASADGRVDSICQAARTRSTGPPVEIRGRQCRRRDASSRRTTDCGGRYAATIDSDGADDATGARLYARVLADGPGTPTVRRAPRGH